MRLDRRTLTALIILLSVTVLWICVSAPKRAEVQVLNPTLDLGTVVQGGARVARFRVRNSGRAPLGWLEPESSCGCVTVAVPKEVLAPGATGVATFNVDLPSFAGPFDKQVVLHFTDGRRVLTIPAHVVARVDPLLTLDRNWVALRSRGGSQATVAFTSRRCIPGDVVLQPQGAARDLLKLKVRTVDARCAKITCVLKQAAIPTGEDLRVYLLERHTRQVAAVLRVRLL